MDTSPQNLAHRRQLQIIPMFKRIEQQFTERQATELQNRKQILAQLRQLKQPVNH